MWRYIIIIATKWGKYDENGAKKSESAVKSSKLHKKRRCGNAYR